MPTKKKEEANDIVQYLLPQLGSVGIPQEHCKIDTTTDASGQLRGDIWISRKDQSTSGFEKNIICLIEAKHKNCAIGDIDWRDAMEHGKLKSKKQGLAFYVVTNCLDSFRFYNGYSDYEITLDGSVITKPQSEQVLEKIQAQVSEDNSQVYHQVLPGIMPVSEDKFRRSLGKLADTYRSCGLKKGDERIDPTVSFVILKYIGEKEKIQRTLTPIVKVWPDYGSGKGNWKADFSQSCKDIFGGEYGDSYEDFKELVYFSSLLANDHYKRIWEELNQYHFHGCSFDVFGAIYEEFASQTKKREFGEFYTRRHITGIAARLLLRNEVTGRALLIGDPACGSGGFLTEAYKALKNNYQINGKLSPKVQKQLEKDTFYGFDNDEKSVARTQLNMFLEGDGHTHIHHVKDSLVDWEVELGWSENRFDYILANPPMGAYGGEARIDDFLFTNERRNELLFAEKIVKATKPGGEIAIVVPDGMLEAPSRENFRVKLLSTCDVNAVISLPRFAFAPYTKEKTYLLFLRKKQQEEVGRTQIHPIWHFVLDYDGFANSDKRFRTKWHDDLPELEEHFPGAMSLAQLFSLSPSKFGAQRNDFERIVNGREREEGLTGFKYKFVEVKHVNAGNFHNLLSEVYLRPQETSIMTEAEFDSQISSLLTDAQSILSALAAQGKNK